MFFGPLHITSRVSGSKRFQQSGPLTARSLAKQAIPCGEGSTQVAPPGLKVAYPGLQGDKFACDRCADVAARCAATIAFRKNRAKFPYRKSDRECSLNEPDSQERFRWKQTIARRRARHRRKKPVALVVTQSVRTDTGPAREFSGIERSRS
jgi:hypothetical protein